MFTDVPDRSAFVYHYTSVETAVEHILPTRRLRLGAYGKTNDPKETKEWNFGLGGLGADDPYVSLSDVSAKVSAAIKLRAHILCACVDSDSAEIEIAPEIHSRGFSRPRMWDQYGRRHTGVCLVFFRPHLTKLFNEQFRHVFTVEKRVVYQNRAIVPTLNGSDPYMVDYPRLVKVGIDQYARDHIATHSDHLFFEKALDWRDEQEYRWLVCNDSADPVYFNFEKSLSAIVFGQDCPPDQLQRAVQLGRGTGAQFEQLVWKNSAPWLSFRLDWRDL